VIAVVCLNPALDVTHHVPAVDWAGVNRPSAVHARPGGKGLNVARTLHALGVDVLVMGLAGGITGAGVEAALGRLGITAAFTQITGETRRTFTVVDGRGGTALFNEAGPEVKTSEFAQFRARYDKVLAGSAAVVLSGSLPPGLAAETYASLIETAAAAGVPAVLDTHGEALLRGAAAGPAIVKPNLEELEILVGRRLSTPDGADWAAVAAAVARLRAAGAEAVVASLGPEGLLAAALAHGLVLGRPWDERLRHAVALGAATAAAPVAGEFSRADYTSALAAATVQQVHPVHPVRGDEAR